MLILLRSVTSDLALMDVRELYGKSFYALTTLYVSKARVLRYNK